MQIDPRLVKWDEAPAQEVTVKIDPRLVKWDEPSSTVKAGNALNSIPRQIGLTARYALEGIGQTADLFNEPFRGLMSMGLPDRANGAPKSVPISASATKLADFIGLPSPETAQERVVGDASRLVAGAASMGGAGKMVSALPGIPSMVGKVGEFLSSNLPQQFASAAGAGLASGASREAGGNPAMQAVAGVVGGIAGGSVPGAANSLKHGFMGMVNKMTPQQMDAHLSLVFNRAGQDYSEVPEAVRQSLRQELASALQAGRELDPAAVTRLADFKTVGATPTRGAVTQNPVLITREMNLAKMGANTGDEALQGLALVQNRNNSTFIRNLNEQGAGRGNLQAAGEAVTQAVTGRQAALRGSEKAAWEAAKNSPGYTQPIEANVISRINGALGDEGLMPFLNPTISKYMEAFQRGQPFTPQAYKNLQSMLSNEMSRGGNEAAAAGLARRVLEGTELRPITNPGGIDFKNLPTTAATAAAMRAADAAPGQAIDAVNRARAATRAAYAFEDSSPLVRSVLAEGAASDPMRIAQRYVVGGTPNEAKTLFDSVDSMGRAAIKDAIVAHLKEKALNGASDELGKFSQSMYNKALKQIGDAKLGLFFSPEEVSQLKAVGRVAGYTQVQPVGSAVNNSNSGALLLGRGYDLLKGLSSKIPFGNAIVVDPLRNIEVGIKTAQAMKVAPGLLAPVETAPFGARLLFPAAAAGSAVAPGLAGLLSAQ